jgi:SRSO17 transposase
MKVKDGSQGVNEAEFAFLRGWTKRHTRRPGSPVWIIFRRTPGNREDLKYYQSNAPEDASEEVLARVVGLRWPVETALEEAKSELGMDHYETRSWSGWHHQMTLTFLAHHFLVRMRLRMKKNGRDDASASENVGIRSLEAEEHHGARSDQNH